MFLKIKQGNLNIDFIFTWWLTDRNIISILLHLFLPNKIFWILHLIILSKRMKGTTSCKYNMSHPKLQWQEWVKKKCICISLQLPSHTNICYEKIGIQNKFLYIYRYFIILNYFHIPGFPMTLLILNMYLHYFYF